MAVAPDRIKARLRTLFPKANLSQTRLDAIAAKLSPKPADDADDAAIDEILTTYNDDAPMSFEELAKYDDKIRTLEAKTKGQGGNEGGNGGNDPAGKQADSGKEKQEDDMPAWAKALLTEVQTLKSEKQAESVQSKALSDERMKNIPKSYLKGRSLPAKEEELEEWVSTVVSDYSEFAKEVKLQGFGNDAPPAGKGAPIGTKPASQAEIEAVGL